MSENVFESTVRSGVLQAYRPHTRWLSTGVDGGTHTADAAYNITVPEGWGETNLSAYIDRRREEAGFTTGGPALLTGVDLQHARRARHGSVEAIVTAGVSNPATLPLDTDRPEHAQTDSARRPGTINIIVGTTTALSSGALANLVAIVAEAKTATLLPLTGFTGTTSDAIVVGCDPNGSKETFSGSATAVGDATRACVREALVAALESRYASVPIPTSVADATYGIETTTTATVSELSQHSRE